MRREATRRDVWKCLAGVIVIAITWAIGADLLAGRAHDASIETTCQLEEHAIVCKEVAK
jgi:hypothetical protein